MARTITLSLLSVLVGSIFLVSAASAEQRKKCAPGSYWDPRDQKCIWGNGR